MKKQIGLLSFAEFTRALVFSSLSSLRELREMSNSFFHGFLSVRSKFITKISNYLIFGGICLLWSCGTTRHLSKKLEKGLEDRIVQSPTFSKSFTGFALYDPETKAMLYQQDADKYFTPASNTKILSFFTAYQILGDSMPLLHYTIQNDSLIFWGTGNPMLLHPDFEHTNAPIEFLKNRTEKLFFSDHNYQDKRFGAGWSWDDYPYYFQPEKAPMPIYGNIVRVKHDSLKVSMDVHPAVLRDSLAYQPKFYEGSPYIRRVEFGNRFDHNKLALLGKSYEKDIPFDYSSEFLTKLLEDTIGREVAFLDQHDFQPQHWQTIKAPLPDTLYQQLMKDSDNFIAEQLLLLCADVLFDTLDTEMAIEYAKENLYQDYPDTLIWRDGSGLSRYNLFTPRTFIRLWEHIYQEIPQERLFSLIPSGGKDGTLENWYKADEPYIYGKTGTLSNKHSLSGYIICKSGKMLIFSFMHKDYITSSAPMKREMERVLAWIRDNF